MSNPSWTDVSLRDAWALRRSGLTWLQVARSMAPDGSLTEGQVRLACERYEARQAARGPRDTVSQMTPAEAVPLPEEPPAEGASAEGDVELLVRATRTQTTYEALLDALEWHPARLRAAVTEAQATGRAVHVEGDRIGRPPQVSAEEREHVIVPVAHEGIFAVASDIHVGSKYFLREAFQDFIHEAYEKGVRVILGPGDNLDGCYRHSRWEWTHDGYEAQASYMAEVFPRLPGLRYVMITGNHDETFEDAAGLSVCRSLEGTFRAAGRSDLTMVGQRGAYVRLRTPEQRRGLIVHLWHPRDAGAYATSYSLQKRIEGYGVGQKPDVLLCGHYHLQNYCEERGVHAFHCGTWHSGGGAFGRSQKRSAKIGGWIIKYALTEQEAVREVTPTWRSYHPVEEVRDVDLG